MRSFLVVLTRELRGHSRNPLVWGLVLFGGILAAASTRMAAEDLKARLAAYDELTAQRDRDRTRADGQVTGRVAEPGFRTARRPEPLSTIVIGLDPVLPDYWDFGPGGRRTGYLSVRNAVQIDLEFVIRVVLGLLAIMLVIEAIGAERSDGTLLALLGQSLPFSRVIIAKLAAGAVTSAVSVAVIVAITVGGMYLTGITVGRHFLLSALLVGVAGCAYLVTYFAIGAFVTSLVPSLRVALATIIVIWLCGGVIALPVAQLVARVLSPVPPDALLEAQSDSVMREWVERAQRAMGDEYLDKVPAGADWTRMERDPAWVSDAVRRVKPIWDRHVVSLRERLDGIRTQASAAAERQEAIVRWISVLSPGAQFTGAAMNLAGTGAARAARWEAATSDYQRQLGQELFYDPPRLIALVPQTRPGTSPPQRWVVALSQRPLPTFQTLPAFRAPESRGFAAHFRDAIPHLLLQLAYGLGFVVAAMVAFTRLRL